MIGKFRLAYAGFNLSKNCILMHWQYYEKTQFQCAQKEAERVTKQAAEQRATVIHQSVQAARSSSLNVLSQKRVNQKYLFSRMKMCQNNFFSHFKIVKIII